MKRAVLVSVVATLAIASCQQVLGITDVTLTSGSSTGTGGAASSSGSGTAGAVASSSSGAMGGASSSSSSSASSTASASSSASTSSSSSGGVPPTTPSPLTPLNGAHVGTAQTLSTLRPKFSWTKATGGVGAITYDLETAQDPSFTTMPMTVSTIPTTAYQPTTGIAVPTARPVGANLYWHVRACASGACSPWSAARRIALGRPLKDVNGDGFDDLVIGVPDAPMDSAGTALVFLGKASGKLPNAPDVTVPTQYPNEDHYLLGGAVATVDFNGDGYADVVTGSQGLNNKGLVHVFYGGAPPTFTGTHETFTNPFVTPENTWLGYALAVGDFDGDGFGDVLAAAPFDSDGDPSAGFVVVYYGRDNSTPGTPAHVMLSGATEGDNYGTVVAGLGDVDGDGADDFAVGAPNASGGSGIVYVFTGDPMRKQNKAPVQITIAGAKIGQRIAGPGDVNGDGYADLAVTDTSGKVYLYFGSANGIQTTPGWTITGLAVSPVSVLGDANGDGFADFAAGTTVIRTFLGRATPPAMSSAAQADGSLNSSIGNVIGAPTWTGDIDGDGIADLITPRDTPPSTQLFIFLSNGSQYPAGTQNWANEFTPNVTTTIGYSFN